MSGRAPSRRGRALRAEELALWRAVTRHVTPFAGRDALSQPDPQPLLSTPVSDVSAAPAPRVSPPAPPAPARAPEPRLLSRLQARKVSPQARLDLHGLRQVEAHAALSRFLRGAHAKGLRMVLVITGKGDGEGEAWWEGRGVLRRSLPNWLDTPEMRTLVVAFQEADQRHGGAGAFYVQLRKPARGGAST